MLWRLVGSQPGKTGTHASTSSDTAPPVEKTTPPSSSVTLIDRTPCSSLASTVISPLSVVKLNLPSSMSSKLTVISSPVLVLRTVIVPASSSVETSSSSGLSLTTHSRTSSAGLSSKSAANILDLTRHKESTHHHHDQDQNHQCPAADSDPCPNRETLACRCLLDVAHHILLFGRSDRVLFPIPVRISPFQCFAHGGKGARAKGSEGEREDVIGGGSPAPLRFHGRSSTQFRIG